MTFRSIRIIECAAVMTAEQLRVVLPLLPCHHVISIVASLEHESQVELALNMIQGDTELKKTLIPSLTTQGMCL